MLVGSYQAGACPWLELEYIHCQYSYVYIFDQHSFCACVAPDRSDECQISIRNCLSKSETHHSILIFNITAMAMQFSNHVCVCCEARVLKACDGCAALENTSVADIYDEYSSGGLDRMTAKDKSSIPLCMPNLDL